MHSQARSEHAEDPTPQLPRSDDVALGFTVYNQQASLMYLTYHIGLSLDILAIAVWYLQLSLTCVMYIGAPTLQST